MSVAEFDGLERFGGEFCKIFCRAANASFGGKCRTFGAFLELASTGFAAVACAAFAVDGARSAGGGVCFLDAACWQFTDFGSCKFPVGACFYGVSDAALISRAAIVDNATAFRAVIRVGAAGVRFAFVACATLLIAQQAVRGALKIRLTRQIRFTLVGHATFAVAAIRIRRALHALLVRGMAHLTQLTIQRVFARCHAHSPRQITYGFSGHVGALQVGCAGAFCLANAVDASAACLRALAVEQAIYAEL